MLIAKLPAKIGYRLQTHLQKSGPNCKLENYLQLRGTNCKHTIVCKITYRPQNYQQIRYRLQKIYTGKNQVLTAKLPAKIWNRLQN